MAKEGTDYSLHVRLKSSKKKTRRIFYAQFKLDNGKWSNAKSTGLEDRGEGKNYNRRDYQAACRWAERYIASGQVVTKERMTFESYAQDFFDWQGDWAKEKRLRGRKISEEQCHKHAQSVKNHLVPYFGKMRLAAIDDEDIRKWQRKMADEGLSGSTINRNTVALRLVLKGAYREKLLRRMPVVEAVAEMQESRGTYTAAEIRAIFSQDWPDVRCMVAAKTAVTTGLRASEIVALRRSSVHEEYVEVLERWNPRWGIGPTKNRKTRIVPIPAIVYRDLSNLIAQNPYPAEPDPFVFFDLTDSTIPMDQANITVALKAELDRIGITEAIRQSRRLDLHSMRHTFNTLLVDRRIPMQTVQSVVGHLSDEMTQRYYHAGDEALGGIRQIQEGILSAPKKNVGH